MSLPSIFEHVAEQMEALHAGALRHGEKLILIDRNIIEETKIRIDCSHEEYSSACGQGKYNPSPIKIAAIICFWVKKLKPYRIDDAVFDGYPFNMKNPKIDPNIKVFINEVCAFSCGVAYLAKTTNLAPKIRDNRILTAFFSSLRYESFSIPSLISFFQCCYGLY